VVLALSLKSLLLSVCYDSDGGYSIPPIQLPCLVVKNGSLGICLSGLLVPLRAALTGRRVQIELQSKALY
jgi:hypothetical protein